MGKEEEGRPPTPLEQVRIDFQRLSQLAFIAKHGGQVDRRELCDSFGNTFESLDNLMNDFGITFREVFVGNDVEG